MQCVERGLITLDEDVRLIIPEIGNLDIISKDADGNIIHKQNNSAITLRYVGNRMIVQRCHARFKRITLITHYFHSGSAQCDTMLTVPHSSIGSS